MDSYAQGKSRFLDGHFNCDTLFSSHSHYEASVGKITITMASISPESPTVNTFTARCYCGSIHYTLHVSSDVLPLSAYMCHCSHCRYTHGAMAVTCARIPRGSNLEFIKPSSLESSTNMYRSKGSVFNYHFCTTCGCHMGGWDSNEGIWHLSISLLPCDESVFRIDEHCATSSAPHGIHEWLPRIGDRGLKMRESNNDTPVSSAAKIEARTGTSERLRAQCDCGGISFTFPRPTDEVFKDPYMKGFVSPMDKTKWKAMTDACNDCRLVSGVLLSAWTYVPLNLIEPNIDQHLEHGTMKSYLLSPGTVRTFCKICGATAIYWSKSRHTNDVNHVINVSVGLLRVREGVNAENWLTWRTNELGWLDAGCKYARDIYESLNSGHQDWGVETNGRLIDFKLPNPLTTPPTNAATPRS